MNNIIIIGNGFDLSHHLPTDYSSFIEHLILTEINKKHSDLLRPFISRPIKEIMNKVTNEKKSKYTTSDNIPYLFFTNNYFLADLVERKENNSNDWSNIESFYFETLKNSNDDELEKLQNDFDVIKQKLINYLNSITAVPEANINFNHFFGHNYFKVGSNENNVILNFNYTETPNNLYNDKLRHFKVDNVHGKLTDKDPDSIIFGHDMSQSDYRRYLAEKGNDFFKNIKFYNYRLYPKFENLELFLGKSSLFNVFILGHSCSISDNQVLQTIFENKLLNKVCIFYYKEKKYYLNQRSNIDRIMSETALDIDNKIMNMSSTVQLALYDDDDSTKVLINNKIDKILGSNEFNKKEFFVF